LFAFLAALAFIAIVSTAGASALSSGFDSAGERGLLGVAFDPAFASNGYVYVYYTAATPTLHNRVSRFTASGDVAAVGSEVPIST
jgi:glucose/arabinose dehydrogenase